MVLSTLYLLQGDPKKTSFSVLAGYPVKIYKNKLYDDFLYMNTHFFHFINQTLSLKLKAHFAAKVYQMTLSCTKKAT